MGTVKTICFVLVFSLSVFGFGQTDDEAILWSPKEKLSWKNFKAAPPKSDRVAATTASGITYGLSATYKGTRVNVDSKVSAFFYPHKSWYKPALANDLILSHEQLHFDISELFARKMRMEIARTRFTKNVKAEVRAIYKRILGELNDFQNRYDKETNFSRDTEKQLQWNLKIAKALKKP